MFSCNAALTHCNGQLETKKNIKRREREKVKIWGKNQENVSSVKVYEYKYSE